MQVKSTEARLKLKPLLQQVHETGEPVEILLDGKVVARLTLDEPTGMPPARIKLAEAKNGWSELLNYVFIMGARYYFRVRFEEDEPAPYIYLVRPPKGSGNRNRFDEEWKAHKAKHRAPEVNTDNLQERVEELQETFQEEIGELKDVFMDSFEKINQKINVAFATMTRPNNDIMATPELGTAPLKSASDLDRFEVD